MSDASVILADEPLAHVDVVRKPDFWNVVDRWFNRKESAFVFSCHEPEIILKHAERVIVMESGRITFDGSVDLLYEAPPSKITGQFLGPLNWLESRDQQILTGVASDNALAVRPERVNVTEDSDGRLEVISSRRTGSFLETLLRSRESGDQAILLHFGQRPIPELRRVAVRMDRNAT
jgi:ABC-type sulfate/molybdate transport systems ATPase subunit